MKNLILHNVRLQQADKLVATETEAKALQHDFDTNMNEEMADVITENVLKQMSEIVDNDSDFAPLTDNDYKKVTKVDAIIILIYLG